MTRGRFHIRPVQPDDLELLMPLIQAHMAYEGDTWQDHGQQQRLHGALFGPQPRLFGFAAFEDERAVGYATASLEYSTWQARDYLHMDCLYLYDDVRGQGLGKQLFEQLECLARAQGCVLIQWQTPASNLQGQRFYAKLGASSKPKLRYYQPVAPAQTEGGE